jgi:two-component sensor histidine kinase
MNVPSIHNDPSIDDATFLLTVIHRFVQHTATAETYQSVFWAITRNFMQTLALEDCVVYEAIPSERKIVQRAAHGNKNPEGEVIHNLLTLSYGEGIVGWVAENQRSQLVKDTRNDKRYLVDDADRLSELCVPIIFHGELLGIICSEHSKAGYYNNRHLLLFELIAEISASLLVRIRQKRELDQLKMDLERLLHEKKEALDQAIETVSDQVSELKYHQDKKDILVREVHHRVNNNLQIISSLVRLYLHETQEPGYQTLQEIQFRIQVLSSIHLILLKSVELNQVVLLGFLQDLAASIRYMCTDKHVVIACDTPIRHLSLNTLVPLGMLIHELVLCSIRKYLQQHEPIKIEISLRTGEFAGQYLLELSGMKVPELAFPESTMDRVQFTLIEALSEQLEGELYSPQQEQEPWRLTFREI